MNPAELKTPDLTYTLPPPDLVMPQVFQQGLLWVFGICALLFLFYAIYLSVKRQSLLPVLFVVAGGFSILLEPMADVLGNVIHPATGQINAFQAEGHPIPWHVILGYITYYGYTCVILFDRFRAQDMTPAAWWKLAFWTFVGVTLFEQIPIYYGAWVYYGVHVMHLGLMPISMAAPNAASIMIPALLVYRLMPYLTGWRQLIVLALIPCTVVGTHAGASVPSYTVLGQNTAATPMWILYAGSLLTTGFAFMLIWLGIGIVHNRFTASNAQKADAAVGKVKAA